MTPKIQSRDGLDEKMLRAMSNPMRLEALRLFNESAVASTNEIAQRMGVDVKKLSYHVRILKECNCIELVDSVQRRGATERYYRATKRADITRGIAKLLPKSLREGMTGQAISAIVDRVAESVKAGVFDARSNRFVAWMPLTLDEEGWAEFIQLKNEQLELEMEIEKRSQQRLAGSGDPGIPATTVSLLFEMPTND